MSKEYLEALEHFVRTSVWNDDEFHEIWDNGNSDLEIVKQALHRLEAIDNANPSEALEKLEKIGHLALYESYNELQVNEVEEFNFVKQSLLKAQEQEKILSIIKEKNADISILEYSETVDDYNNAIVFKFKPSAYESCKLTQEEFELLKRWTNE